MEEDTGHFTFITPRVAIGEVYSSNDPFNVIVNISSLYPLNQIITTSKGEKVIMCIGLGETPGEGDGEGERIAYIIETILVYRKHCDRDRLPHCRHGQRLQRDHLLYPGKTGGDSSVHRCRASNPRLGQIRHRVLPTESEYQEIPVLLLSGWIKNGLISLFLPE